MIIIKDEQGRIMYKLNLIDKEKEEQEYKRMLKIHRKYNYKDKELLWIK